MNNSSSTFKQFLIKYKWLIVPGVPLLFFTTVMMLTFYPVTNGDSSNNTPLEKPIPSPTRPTERPVSNITPKKLDKELLETLPGLLKKETLPNNTIIYTFSSNIEDRPNIFITTKTNDIIFQRKITNPSLIKKTTDYTDNYGPPKFIFKGSKHYGPDAQSYIYADLGVAFIANPQDGEVFEEHIFLPMTIDEYVENYGEDIPSQP